MFRRWTFLALLLLATPVASAAQLVTGSIHGQITMGGGPTGAYTVGIPALGVSTRTGANGEFRLDGLPQGSYDVVVRALDRDGAYTLRQHVVAGRALRMDVRLEHAQRRAPAVPPAGSSGLLFDGRLLRELPIDGAFDAAVLVPGVTLLGESRWIRGSATDPALYIDGISARNLRTGAAGALRIGEPALSQFAATTGLVSAWIGGTAGGTLELFTTRGGEEWQGDVRLQSAGLAPQDWRRDENRGWFAAGGPLPFMSGLRLHVAGSAVGRPDAGLPRGLNDLPVYVASGVDTTFTLPRTPSMPGSTADSVQVTVPLYARLDRSTAAPLGQSDAYTFSTRLSWSGTRGARADATLYHSRDQQIRRDLNQLYNPDGWRGSHQSGTRFALQGRVPLSGSLALNLQAAHDRDWAQQGAVRQLSANAHRDASFGFSREALDFHMDADEWTVTPEVIRAWRDSSRWGRSLTTEGMPLTVRQSVPGVAGNLRLNPYGMPTQWPISGLPMIDTGGERWGEEKRLSFGGSLEWQPATGHSGVFGVELTRANTRELNVDLTYDWPTELTLHEPQLAAVFAQHRVERGRFSAEAGVRVERFDPDAEVPVVPGFLPYTGGSYARASSRTVAAPKVAAAFAAPYDVAVRASFSESARFPGLVGPGGIAQHAHLSVQQVNPGDVSWGQDVAPPRGRLVEVGAGRHAARGVSADVSYYRLTLIDPLQSRHELFSSPLTGADIFLRVLTNGEAQTSSGVDISVYGRLLGLLSGNLGYGYSDHEMRGPHTFSGMLSLQPGHRMRSGSTLATVLHGTALHAVGHVTSGQTYRRLHNVGDGHISPPVQFAGTPTAPTTARTPALKGFDLRLTHELPVRGVRLQGFADMRNALGFTNTHALFAETDDVTNPLHRERLVTQQVFSMSGGTGADMDIRAMQGLNELNRHMLLRAEQRFGNGDAIFTVDELRSAAGAWYDLHYGPQWLQSTGRTLRLGVQVNF